MKTKFTTFSVAVAAMLFLTFTSCGDKHEEKNAESTEATTSTEHSDATGEHADSTHSHDAHSDSTHNNH